MPAWRLHKAFNRRGGRVTVNGLLDGNLLIPQFAWMKAPFIYLFCVFFVSCSFFFQKRPDAVILSNGDVSFFSQLQRSRNKQMKEIFPEGFGIHHAGMLRSDRNLMESMFSRGYIKVLICTATLAWGVNLPAHAVIIKVLSRSFHYSSCIICW